MRKQRGVAIVTAIAMISLIIWIATELSYETTIEYGIHARSTQRLQAYYASRAGIELSLFRIKLFNQAKDQFGAQLGDQSHLINMIWEMPFFWPPLVDENIAAVKKELVQDSIKESILLGSYDTQITDEGSKIDLNNLGSPLKKIQDNTKKRLIEILETQFKNDNDFATANKDLTASEIINHIQDWIDPDDQSQVSGSEKSFYPEYANLYPPNRGLRATEELKLIKGVSTSVYDLLKDQITVFGTKSINPNSAHPAVLEGLDESITQEIVTEVLNRRSNPQLGGPFKSADEFWQFINSKGGRVSQEKQIEIPLIFDTVTTFRIKSTGKYKDTSHTIEVVVSDINKLNQELAKNLAEEILEKELKKSTTKDQTNNQKQDKGPPRILYWFEK